MLLRDLLFDHHGFVELHLNGVSELPLLLVCLLLLSLFLINVHSTPHVIQEQVVGLSDRQEVGVRVSSGSQDPPNTLRSLCLIILGATSLSVHADFNIFRFLIMHFYNSCSDFQFSVSRLELSVGWASSSLVISSLNHYRVHSGPCILLLLI